jgi:hypothetical protein
MNVRGLELGIWETTNRVSLYIAKCNNGLSKPAQAVAGELLGLDRGLRARSEARAMTEIPPPGLICSQRRKASGLSHLT